MKNSVILLLFMAMLLLCSQAWAAASPKKVLVFTKTTGFRHANIEKGVTVLKNIFSKEGIAVSHTEDANVFLADSLQYFQAVIF